MGFVDEQRVSASDGNVGDLERVLVEYEYDALDRRIENELTSRIRATSDIRLDGVRFETHRKRKRVYECGFRCKRETLGQLADEILDDVDDVLVVVGPAGVQH